MSVNIIATGSGIVGTARSYLIPTHPASGILYGVVGNLTGLGSKPFSVGVFDPVLSFEGIGGPVLQGEGDFDSPIRTKIVGIGTSLGNSWLAGIELITEGNNSCDFTKLCPTVAGYGYTPDAGLVRTEMQDGVIRQRRRWKNARLTINLRFQLTQQCLAAADQFFVSTGSNWFTIEIITGKKGPERELHTVRLISDPVANMMSGQRMYEYLITVETQD